MAISAAAAGLLGALIGAGGTIMASWLQKSREIEWQRIQRDQEGLEDLGRALAKLGQHYVDIGETWMRDMSLALDQSSGHELRAQVTMLVEFYASELKEDHKELDEAVLSFRKDIQRVLFDYHQGEEQHDGTVKVTKEALQRQIKLPSTGAGIRNSCYELMTKLAALRQDRAIARTPSLCRWLKNR